MTGRAILPTLAVIGLAVGLLFAVTSPPDAIQGDFVRIMYVHVPSAWLAFLAFGITLVGSLGWLFTRKMRWDRLAAASAEVGVMFTGLALLTGMIWGRPVWGVWWDWTDARMMSTALMFFIYLGYLGLRSAATDPEDRARRSSILGVIAFVMVPLVYFSVNLFRTLHQTQTIRPDGAQMDPAMLVALEVNLVAFSILFVALVVARMRIARLEDAVEESGAVAASGISAPTLDTGGTRDA